MAGEWAAARLEEVAAGIQTGPFGSQLHASDYVPAGVPVVMPTNIRDRRIDTEGISFIGDEDADRLSRHKLQLNDLVFSRRGEVDKCALVTRDTVGWLCGTGCLLVRPDAVKCDPAFLSFHISAPDTREWLKQHAVGLVMPNLNTEILSSIPLNLPPLGEQRRIAHLLGSLDDKIELNRRMAATLEEMARALFKSWFVDFDPVRTKAEGRDPGLPAATAALFPDAFGEDGIPVGWTKASLLDHARLISGGTPRTEEPSYWDGPILWASAKDVSQCADRFLTITERTITPRGLEESATRMVPALSTVVVARGATTGRHCLFGGDMAMNQTCYALHSEAHRPFWLACTFSALVDELVHGAHGSVFDTITTTTLQTAKIVHAGGEIVSAFERTIQPIYERILSLVEEAATLRTLRDTLLPKLISGELRIKDANGAVEAA